MGPPAQTLPLAESATAPESHPHGDVDSAGPAAERRPIAEADWRVLARGVAEGKDGHRRSVWIRVIPDPSDPQHSLLQAPAARWRYPDLDELLARRPERQPAFQEAVADADPVVATNAAIAMARLGDASGAERLFHAASSPKLPLPMRCAAIEALGALAGDAPAQLLSELLDQYGESTGQDERRIYVPELHSELVSALGRHKSPADDPRFLAALRSNASEVRLEALRVWANDEASALPEALIDLRASGDVRVRMAVAEAIAMRRHPDAHRLLAEMLRDHDLRAKLAAVRALGMLGDADAKALLTSLLSHHAGRLREAAVAALARTGEYAALTEAAGDESWRVRAEAARGLAGFHGPEAVTIARTLLDDSSTEVHRELLAAIGQWPVEQAGPVLLAAMEKESFLCRKTAADLLAEQWSPAASFPAEAPPDRRQVALRTLAESFRRQFHLDAERAGEPTAAHPGRAIASEELHRVAQLIVNDDLAGLAQLGTRLVDVLEVLVIDRQQPLPDAVYQQALPEVHPAFAQLARLETNDVMDRRRAAAQLATAGEKGPLGRLAVERLYQLVAPEADSLVFQSALTAVAADGGDAACRLAYVAVGHPAAEVRRRGCMHLAAHPHPKHTPVLLPAVDDPSDSVAAAAVVALGACGQLSDAAALDELMRSGNESLQMAAAFALVQLDDPRGSAALERLAYSRDSTIRRHVAEKMGELADPVFTPTLIRLLDDRVSVLRAALSALPETVGEDKSASPDGSPATTTERVRRWKAWYASQ